MDEEVGGSMTSLDLLSTSICVVCNSNFTNPALLQNLNQYMHMPEELTKMEECIAINFGLSTEEKAQTALSTNSGFFPFCSKCTPIAKELLNLQTSLTEIQDKLSRVRMHLASVIVNTYVYTSDESPFFEMKSLIFEKWYDKIDEDPIEQEMFELHKSTREKIETPPLSTQKEHNSERVSRELRRLTRMEKGDKRVISIDDGEVDEFTCRMCKKVCRSKINLISHMKSHTGDARPYVCCMCKKSYFDSTTYKKHMKSKHDFHFDEQEEIPIGNDTTPHLITTEIAKVTMENGEEAQLIIGTRTETPPPQLEDQTLANHEDFELSEFNSEEMEEPLHDTLPETTTCDQCGRKFVSRVTLTKHIRTVHLKTIKVECPICKMTTRDHYNLSKHVLIHDPKLTKLVYNCPFCGVGFTMRKDCLVHFRAQHNIIPGNEYTRPILRAVKEHDSLNLDMNDATEGYEQNIVTEPIFNQQSLIFETETGSPLTSLESKNYIQTGEADPETGEADFETGEADFETGEADFETGEANFKWPNTSIMSPEKAAIKPIQQRKIRKRRRRPLLTYSTKTKLYKQRVRLLSEKSNSNLPTTSNFENEVKPEPQHPNDPTLMTIALTIPPGSLTNKENDEILVQQAQRNYISLQKLNFNLYVQTENVQTVMLSPMRDSEDMDTFCSSVNELEEIIDSLPESKEKETTMWDKMNHQQRLNGNGSPKIKIYGPKSKLEEIRRKALLKASPKLTEIENSELPPTVVPEVVQTSTPTVESVNVKTEQPEICTMINSTKVLPKPALITCVRPKLAEQMKPKVKMYGGPKSKMDAAKSRDVTAGGNAQPGIWKGTVTWSPPKKDGKTYKLQPVKSNTSTLPNWQSYLQAVRTNTSTLPIWPSYKTNSPSQTSQQTKSDNCSSSATDSTNDRKKLILKRVMMKKSTGCATSSVSSATESQNSNFTPILQPAPTRFTSAYWEDPSKILSYPTTESSSLTPFLLSSLNREMNPWKLSNPNKNTKDQISNSMTKVPPKEITPPPPSIRASLGKPKCRRTVSQLIKTGITKLQLASVGRSSPHLTFGPVIESTRSLANQMTAFRLVKTEVRDGTRESGSGVLTQTGLESTTQVGPCQTSDLMDAIQASPKGKTVEVEALLKDTSIDDSVVNTELWKTNQSLVDPRTNVGTNEFKLPRLPAGITLVQVENAHEGSTPPSKTNDTKKSAEMKINLAKPNPNSKYVGRLSFGTSLSHVGNDTSVEMEEVTYGELSSSATIAPIQIRNIASITEPETNDMEDSELYQPISVRPSLQKNFSVKQQTVVRNKSLIGVTEIKLPPRLIIPRATASIIPRNRRIRQSEIAPIIKYSELQRIRQEQSSRPQPEGMQVQRFGSPMSMGLPQVTTDKKNVVIPLQTINSTGDTSFALPTFIQVPASTLTSEQIGDLIMKNNMPMNFP